MDWKPPVIYSSIVTVTALVAVLVPEPFDVCVGWLGGSVFWIYAHRKFAR